MWNLGWHVQSHQCLWKPEQKETFIDTARAFALDARAHGTPTWVAENECNFYVGPDDGGVQAAAMRSLVGIAYLRDIGGPADMEATLSVARHLRQLGKHVPVFKLSHERRASFDLWQPDRDVDLADHPYDLAEVQY